MTKAAKKRKQSSGIAKHAHLKLSDELKSKSLESSVLNDPALIGGLIYEDELETTTETLITLSRNPNIISLKGLKNFRTAVHDYWRISTEASMTGASLTSRISSALIDRRYIDCLVLLSEMRIRNQVPKLGALQRWVRECDAVFSPAMTRDEENEVWAVLDAILRTTQPETIAFPDLGEGEQQPGSSLKLFKPFAVESDNNEAVDFSQAKKIANNAAAVLKPLQITAGAERRPPNKHPAIIYYSPPATFPLALTQDRLRLAERHDIPGIPGAFIISDVLDKVECQSLLMAAEKVGFEPDEPVSGSAAELVSVLAHNLIWLADPQYIEVLFDRIVRYLPSTIHGGAVKGINARFRLYRYRKGALYRPHIDGAWPASALDSSTQPHSYIYDSDPSVYSRLTLLIYLNDDFDGGCTTFFLPSSAPGVVEARPVKPRAGTVCIFPHGATQGSLLHEGSGVCGDGAKYVIRTEVLYEVQKKERTDAKQT